MASDTVGAAIPLGIVPSVTIGTVPNPASLYEEVHNLKYLTYKKEEYKYQRKKGTVV